MRMIQGVESTLPPIDALWNSREAHKRSTVDEISKKMVRAQLVRILDSSVFIQSARLSRFLRFVVENTLDNSSNSLKEYVIGTEVYDRTPPYHPSLDSIVRTEARRLRNKLKEYYDSEGKSDPIFIYFRTGSYIPIFRSKEELRVEKYSTKGNGFSDVALQHRIQLLEEEKKSLTQLVMELLCKNQSLERLNRVEL
jgi:hypothetical protein